MQGNGKYRYTVIAAIIVLMLLAASLVIGAEVEHINADTTPLVSAVLGLCAAIIPALLALLRVDTVNHKVDKNAEKIEDIQTVAHDSNQIAHEIREQINGHSVKDGA
jgi:hypothetical protein